MKTSFTLLAALMASAALVAGCDRADNRAASEDRDVVAANELDPATSPRATTPRSDMRQSGRDMSESAGNAPDAAINKGRDAAITTEVNALLARDQDLSALGINVDTAGGRVVLRGSAPDPAARDRATELAQRVEGVVGVNNELQVRPRN